MIRLLLCKWIRIRIVNLCPESQRFNYIRVEFAE